VGSVCNCNDVANGGPGSDASHASQTHAQSAAKRVLNDQVTPLTKYNRTSAILLGWEPEYCDTGVASEVSSHADSCSKATY
jgi:hypothetical protein